MKNATPQLGAWRYFIHTGAEASTPAKPRRAKRCSVAVAKLGQSKSRQVVAGLLEGPEEK
jgi:hypothetical protein